MAMRLMLLLLSLLAPMAAAAEPPADPLKSPVWKALAGSLLDGAGIVFDERVVVTIPSTTENQAQVPVTVDARALPAVSKLIVFADLNPIQHVLTLTPSDAAPFISFRMKVEQATPVRAAAMAGDGLWHVGGVFLNAAGGGCTAPSAERSAEDWSDVVGQTQGKLWPLPDGLVKARFRLRHPMDTGLAKNNTPAYFIEHLVMRSRSGTPLATLEMFEPVSEDPTITLMPRLPLGDTAIDVEARDNNGNLYRSKLPAPWRQSFLRSETPETARYVPC